MTRRPPPPGRSPAPRRGARGPDPRRRPGSTALPRIILAVFGLLAIGLFGLIVSVYGSFTSGLRDVSEIEDFDLVEGSTVLSADGTELATFAVEDRREIDFDQIPQVMIDAQVAAEDQTFWTNPCVDFRSIVRAVLQNFQAGETVSGASTICQQLVRMRLFDADLLADPERQVERKIKEAILALRLDDRYPGEEGKQRIIEMYLNQVYYGNNAYGIWSAANAYFGKDLTSDAEEDQLTVSEAAMLAGLVRAPSRLDPTAEAISEESGGETRYVVPPTAQAIVVRDIVLAQMLQSEFITQAEHDAAVAEEIELAPPRDRSFLAPHFVFAVRREANELLEGEEALDTDGLRIITTLDYQGYQTVAEKWARIGYDLDRLTDEELAATYGEAALPWIKQLQGRNINNDAIVTVNYRTGAVLAYVGSSNFDGESTPEHQPNFDVIGQAYRQSGSAFKPITYAAGFESGVISPATMLMDVRTDIAEGFDPPNADGRERGPVRVRDALKYSLNVPVSKAQQLIGTENVVAMAERLGLEFDPLHNDEHAVPSLTLGTLGIHQLDLAGAYGAIANGGRLQEPYLIERIEVGCRSAWPRFPSFPRRRREARRPSRSRPRARGRLPDLSSLVSASRYTREPRATSLAAASSQSGEKPKAAIDPSSTTLPALLRIASSLAAGTGSPSAEAGASTPPTSSIEIRSRFFAVASYRRERRTKRGSRNCADSWIAPATAPTRERTSRSGRESTKRGRIDGTVICGDARAASGQRGGRGR